MKNINKEMTIEEILNLDPSLGEIFLGFDMHCIYCPMGRLETLEEACTAHGVDINLVLKKINEALNFKVAGKVKKNEKIKKAKIDKI